MTFFADDCPYSPVSLAATKTTISMIVQVLPITTNTSVGGSTSSYSTCPYTDSVTTLQEIRNLKTGALIKRITLGNYRTAILH